MPAIKTYGKKTQTRPKYASAYSWSTTSPSKTAEGGREDAVASLQEKMRSLVVEEEEMEGEEREIQKKLPLRAKDANSRSGGRLGGLEKDGKKTSEKRDGAKTTKEKVIKEVEVECLKKDSSRLTVTRRERSSSATEEQTTSTKQSRDRPSTPEPTIISEPKDAYSYHTQDLLRLCNDRRSLESGPEPFSEWSLELDEHFHITKIAEASYGEVYRLSLKQEVPGFNKSNESVMKLIALKPPGEEAFEKFQESDDKNEAKPKRRRSPEQEPEEEDTSWMSCISAVASEVTLLRRLSSIPGFTNFRDMRVLRGRPGKPFVNAWKAYNKSKPRGQKSIYPDPSKKLSYNENQLWAVIEMQDAGTDLERVHLWNVWSVWDVFWGVVFAVAKGEENARFEHRDLHLGNVCIRSTRDEDIHEPIVGNVRGKFGFTGLEPTIIDYGLSRVEMISDVVEPAEPVTPGTKNGEKEEEVAFWDLDLDPAVFEGDGEVEYQYDMYRYMRSVFFLDDPLAEYPKSPDHQPTKSWREYCPKTNLVWLHFLLHSLMAALPDSDDIYALDYLSPGESSKLASKKAEKLLRRLQRLDKALDFRAREGEIKESEEPFGSATDLVEWAVESNWLGEKDVLGIPA